MPFTLRTLTQTTLSALFAALLTGESVATELTQAIQAQQVPETAARQAVSAHPASSSSDSFNSMDSSSWWTEDVWAAPDRPFLYYGESRDVRPKARTAPRAASKSAPQANVKPPEIPPAPPKSDQPVALTRLTTMAEVRAEYDARLDRAVMNPTAENVEAFLAVNAFVLERSHRFAEAFDRGRITHPTYDWTSTHPSANFASTELGQLRDSRTDELLASLQDDVGLLFVGGADENLNTLAAGPVKRFAAASGLELLAVHTAQPIEALASKPDNGIVASVLGALHLSAPEAALPALILIPRPGSTHPAVVPLAAAPLLIASGVQSVSELKRRTVLLLATAPGNASNASFASSASKASNASLGGNGANGPASTIALPSAALIDRIPRFTTPTTMPALPDGPSGSLAKTK